jgi:hypothetical protein
VTQLDKMLGQPRHNSFGAAVELRWHTFGKRGYLSNTHVCVDRGLRGLLLTVAKRIDTGCAHSEAGGESCCVVGSFELDINSDYLDGAHTFRLLLLPMH